MRTRPLLQATHINIQNLLPRYAVWYITEEISKNKQLFLEIFLFTITSRVPFNNNNIILLSLIQNMT
ncbi:hypothetical protein MQ284_000884 [Listeria monocytogenes]|nr:hypothetical protein [Listeria monocytogenes]